MPFQSNRIKLNATNNTRNYFKKTLKNIYIIKSTELSAIYVLFNDYIDNRINFKSKICGSID